MADQFLHLAYLPRSVGFALPVASAIRAAKSSTLRARADAWSPGQPLSELALAITTKIMLLRATLERLRDHLVELDTDLAARDDLRAHLDEAAGLVTSDRELPYRILSAVDAFIYEFRSAYEITGKFVRCFGEEILGVELTESKIREIVRDAGISDAWVTDLQDQRKLFFHDTAPWLALRLESLAPLKVELLVLKHHDRNLADSPSVIPFSRLTAIHAGMLGALQILSNWMVTQVARLDGTGQA